MKKGFLVRYQSELTNFTRFICAEKSLGCDFRTFPEFADVSRVNHQRFWRLGVVGLTRVGCAGSFPSRNSFQAYLQQPSERISVAMDGCRRREISRWRILEWHLPM